MDVLLYFTQSLYKRSEKILKIYIFDSILSRALHQKHAVPNNSG